MVSSIGEVPANEPIELACRGDSFEKRRARERCASRAVVWRRSSSRLWTGIFSGDDKSVRSDVFLLRGKRKTLLVVEEYCVVRVET